MNNIEKIRQEIERQIGSVNEKQDANPAMPKYRWHMYEGMKEAFLDMKYFIDSLPEDASCTYDTNKLTPTPSVNIEDVARVQFASHAHVFDHKRKAVFDWEQFKEVVGIFYGFGKKNSLPEENQKHELVAKVWESEHGFRDLEMNSESFRKALEGFKDGDKVKLFIVKEDDED